MPRPRALYVNKAYEVITGRSCQSLTDNPISYEEVIHPDDRVHVLTKLEEAAQNGRFDERLEDPPANCFVPNPDHKKRKHHFLAEVGDDRSHLLRERVVPGRCCYTRFDRRS